MISADDLLDKLRQALSRDGDFPVSAKIVNELKALTSDPRTTANQITEIILREPSLGTRILHLVNSGFFRRGKPIMTVSQAVVQIGMRPLAELCSGLVLLQRFVPSARRSGPFAQCLRKLLVTSLLSSAFGTQKKAASGSNSKNSEFGYLTGSLAEMGTLLLAFYFPQIFDAAKQRSDQKQQSLEKSIEELTGVSSIRLSIEVVEALGLPPQYKEILETVEKAQKDPSALSSASLDVGSLASAVGAARVISTATVGGTEEDLRKALSSASKQYSIDQNMLESVLQGLSSSFNDQCRALDLQLPEIPAFVETVVGSSDGSKDGGEETDTPQRFQGFLAELRQAVDNREPTASIITSVMETLAWGLGFERVLLLLMNGARTQLLGRMILGTGVGQIDPKTVVRPTGQSAPTSAPDNKAVREGRPVFIGSPVLTGGWPIAVIPIGAGLKCIGVIYADKDSLTADKADLTAQEQASLGILAELLSRSVAHQKQPAGIQ